MTPSCHQVVGRLWSLGLIASSLSMVTHPTHAAATAPTMCPGDNGGLTLSPGFCATLFADNIGHARHLVVAGDGTVYVNTWSGAYYPEEKLPDGGFLVALKDSDGDGRADVQQRFGPTAEEGSSGGTGLALFDGALYAEMNDKVIRVPLPKIADASDRGIQTVVSGMPLTGNHPMHPLLVDTSGNLFVSMGSASNACQEQDRSPGSPGARPCTELDTRAGIWKFDARKVDQKFSSAQRYARGIRNAGGMASDAAGRIFVTQHGRDQLPETWPALFNAKQGQELPAELMFELRPGADYGWPECYFDGLQAKSKQSPEYGGDGKKVGNCASRAVPAAIFPAHWAPNAVLIYSEKQFPEPYREGAFVAFHGSWNRAPGPQGGYNVVYQPMSDGRAEGKFVVFADGFAGRHREPGRALSRPAGLASGPDGAIYVSDDVRGRVWRIAYSGVTPAPTLIAAAPLPVYPRGADDGAPSTATLPVPKGGNRAQLELGRRIFLGEAGGGTCSGCHGSDGRGSSVGPSLTSGNWIWGDGSLEFINGIITAGVTKPKRSEGVMPPLGGANLSQEHLAAVSAYVWAMGQAAPK